jgi:GWxTD domain-containing protein
MKFRQPSWFFFGIILTFLRISPILLPVTALHAAPTDKDSLTTYKNRIASDLHEYDNLSGAAKLVSKIFNDQLGKIEKNINKILSVSPNDIDGLFLKGILQRFQGKLGDAEQTFKKVVAIDDRFGSFGFSNVWLQLGMTYKEKSEFDKAVEAFKQGALINLNDTWPLINLSQVFIEMNRPEEASEAFYGGLSQIQDSANINHLFIDCKDIASKAEVEKWDSLKTKEQRLEFLKIFWKKRDPNPIDEVNQLFVEHYSRLNYARSNYGSAFAPWYDDRGQIYIRLGKPEKVYYGKPRDGIRENESWFYDNIRAGLFFDFVSNGSTYDLRPLLDAAERTATMEEVYEMLEERSIYNGYYHRLAEKIKLQGDVQHSRDVERMGARGVNLEQYTKSEYASSFLQRSDNLQDYTNFLSYTKNQQFIFDPGAPHLPINCNFASFQSSKKESRLEFYYVVPFGQLNFIPSISQSNSFSTAIKFSMKIYDLKYNELKSVDTLYHVNASGSEIGSHYFLDEIDQTLPPGKYVVALELRNNEKDRVGVYQFVVSVHDFSADTLTVSDIEVAQYVDNTLIREKFVKPKSNLKVVPNPAVGIVKTKPLTVYYEIYNLALNKDGKSSYQVSYSIKMLETNQSFLSSIAGVFSSKKESSTSSVTVKEGKSSVEREYIGFDISELPKGVASLEIKVKDLSSGKESSRKINLTLEEERKLETKSESNKK